MKGNGEKESTASLPTQKKGTGNQETTVTTRETMLQAETTTKPATKNQATNLATTEDRAV